MFTFDKTLEYADHCAKGSNLKLWGEEKKRMRGKKTDCAKAHISSAALCTVKFNLEPFHITKVRAALSHLTTIKALNHIFNFFL